MKLFSRLLMVFGRNFCKKPQTWWVSEPHYGKLGVTHDLGWWLIGKRMFHFLFALTELFFAIFCASGVMRRNVYSSAVFTGGRPLCTQILPGQSRPPSTTLGTRKLETLGYPAVKTASLCVPSFWHNTGVWQTDRQTCWVARRLSTVRLLLWINNSKFFVTCIVAQPPKQPGKPCQTMSLTYVDYWRTKPRSTRTDSHNDRRWIHTCITIYTVFQKKTPTHIVGYKLRNSCLILIIFDTEIPDIIWHRMTA